MDLIISILLICSLLWTLALILLCHDPCIGWKLLPINEFTLSIFLPSLSEIFIISYFVYKNMVLLGLGIVIGSAAVYCVISVLKVFLIWRGVEKLNT